jgi:hypothetical protein
MMLKMKHSHTENGFCRTYYKYKSQAGQNLLYCLMEDEGIVRMYRCSMDGEPDYVVGPVLKNLELELPTDEYGKVLHRRYLNSAE